MSLATGGEPSGYWEIYKGTSWGGTTVNNGAPFPYLASAIKANQITTSATCSTSGVTGDWDNAYDIWFNADKTAGQTNNQGGTHLEMMVWLNHTAGAQPRHPLVASNVPIGGNTYNIWYDPTGPTASYVLSTPSNTISFDMYPLIQDAITRGYMQPSWYLLDVEFGFEIWNGGINLSCSNFAVNAT